MVKSEKIWMNGELVDWDNANVHVLSHTLHYGLGLFEGIRCYDTASGPAVFRLDEHIQRLFKSAHIFMLDIPYSENDITLAVKETIKANNLKECYIRPLVYIGNGGMGLYVEDNSINLAIAVWPWGSYLGEDGIRNGIRVKTSSFVRSSVNSNMARAKVSG
ncbi:MAG TPA: branched chain amino acid aminotransferase, partial [Nitrospirae bacterium]|nr:branched chain amino acid aminotransferase [Nitrospirota bacterium]